MQAEKGQPYTQTVYLVTSADKDTGAEGKAGSMTVELRKAGGAFVDVTSEVTISEIDYGFYDVTYTATHMDTAGTAAVLISDTGVDPYAERIDVVDYDTMTPVLAVLADGEHNKLADHLLLRKFAAALASGDGDGPEATDDREHARSLLGTSLLSWGAVSQDGLVIIAKVNSTDATAAAKWIASGLASAPSVPTGGS